VIEIEKGVPIPSYIDKKIFATMDKMEVGDHFYIEVKPQTLWHKVWLYKKNNPDTNFTTEKEGEGFRVWRTE